MVKRHVGMLEQGLALRAVTGGDRDADRAGHLDRGAVYVDRHEQGPHHLTRQLLGEILAVAAGEEDELVAAEAGDRAAAVDDRGELAGDTAQHLVAGRMTER